MNVPDWTPPSHWQRITAIDAHTGGEPFRVITGGFPELPGKTILEKRRYAKKNLDHLRRALMWEPRGHADMYGCLLTEPVTPGSDLGVLFIHHEGFSTMCGHGIIGLATVVLQTGMLPMTSPETVIRMDTPAGLVIAHGRVAGNTVQSVYFHNVPSFVLALDQTVDVPGIGRVRYDLAFGGAFYAFVQASDVGLACDPPHFRALIEKGTAIKRAVMASRPITHPFEEDLSFLYGTIFIDGPTAPDAHSRNVCIFADGEVDRSPTGTGVSARLAIHHARREITVHQPILIESILGSRFKGRVMETTTFGPYDAIIPEVEGKAKIIGRQEFLFDPSDELSNGFLLR